MVFELSGIARVRFQATKSEVDAVARLCDFTHPREFLSHLDQGPAVAVWSDNGAQIGQRIATNMSCTQNLGAPFASKKFKLM